MASLSLTPRGRLLFTVEDDAFSLSAPLRHRLGTAFDRGSGHGLFELGAGEVGTTLPADLSYWRDFGVRLVSAICTHPDSRGQPHDSSPAPALDELEALVAAAPPMIGADTSRLRFSKHSGPRPRQRLIRARRIEGAGRRRPTPEHVTPTTLGPCHAHLGGFDLHAGLMVRAGQRDRLERLCRYALGRHSPRTGCTCPARGHLAQTAAPLGGRDDAPVELLERLAVLTPQPHVHLILRYGALAPRAAWRARSSPRRQSGPRR